MSATGKLINLIESLAKLGYSLGLGLAVMYVLFLGFKYIRGKEVDKTHHEIILLLVGIILIIISFTIPTLIRSFIEK